MEGADWLTGVTSWVAIYFMLRYDLGPWLYLHDHTAIHSLWIKEKNHKINKQTATVY